MSYILNVVIQSISYYTRSIRVATQLAIAITIDCGYRFILQGGAKIGKGGPVLDAKTDPAGPILATKVVRGTNFSKIFCQNWSGRTDFGMTALASREIT